MNDLKIPVGISDFAKIRNYKYYYVDKTGPVSYTHLTLPTIGG